MKNILKLIITLIFINNIQAQITANELTLEQFNNIKVHGVLKTAIEATEGEIQQMEALFGTSYTLEEVGQDIGEHQRTFRYSDTFYIYFEGLSPPATPSIAHFGTDSITINGITANIGDNISVFGSNLIFSQGLTGLFSVIFTLGHSGCCPIIIRFNQETNIITKIEYFVWT
ncbi:MAG: hypothetical protein IIC74_02590 [Bacteroidetes bacterium]|nr:hypothetical protein [Bacteroidota bacterium]